LELPLRSKSPNFFAVLKLEVHGPVSEKQVSTIGLVLLDCTCHAIRVLVVDVPHDLIKVTVDEDLVLAEAHDIHRVLPGVVMHHMLTDRLAFEIEFVEFVDDISRHPRLGCRNGRLGTVLDVVIVERTNLSPKRLRVGRFCGIWRVFVGYLPLYHVSIIQDIQYEFIRILLILRRTLTVPLRCSCRIPDVIWFLGVPRVVLRGFLCIVRGCSCGGSRIRLTKDGWWLDCHVPSPERYRYWSRGGFRVLIFFRIFRRTRIAPHG
jgi:hypothetical protein